MSANLKDDILRAAAYSQQLENRNRRHVSFDALDNLEMAARYFKQPENYIFDPSYVVRLDGSLYIREVSIIPNPEKGET